MELQEIKKALDEQARAWEEFKEANDKRLELLEAGKGGLGEIEEKLVRLGEAMDAAEEREKEATKSVSDRLDTIEVALKRPGRGGGEQKSAEMLEYEEKWNHWLRTGDAEQEVKALEKKVLRTGSAPDGGYRVPVQMETAIVQRVRETSPMRALATVTSIGGGSWKEARVTGHTSSGGWVSEQGTRSQTGTPTIGITEIVPGEQYEQPPVTQEALDDVDFDVEGWVNDEVSFSMAIRENTAFVTGDGLGKPRGFMTYTAGTDDTVGQIEQVVSGHATEPTADGLIDCQEKLFEPFQPNAQWVMRRATRTFIRKLKDGQSNYLLVRDFSSGAAPTLLGKPITLMADVAAIAGNALAYAYGDFRQGYRIIDRVGIRILRDPYTSKPLVLFYTTKRCGGGVRNYQAIKIGKLST
jgi:HK97 family phage major capsid protein